METDLTVVAYIPEKSDIYHKPDFVCDNLANMSAGEFGVPIVTKGPTQITGSGLFTTLSKIVVTYRIEITAENIGQS